MAKNSWFSCNPKRWIFQNPKWRIFRIADKKFNIWADFPVPFSRIFSFRMRVVSIPEDGMHGARGCMHVLAYQSYHGMQGGLVWHAGQDGEGGAAAAGESAARRLVFPGLMLHELVAVAAAKVGDAPVVVVTEVGGRAPAHITDVVDSLLRLVVPV